MIQRRGFITIGLGIIVLRRGGDISEDPIGLNGGMALYGYVHDVNGWLDVLGLTATYNPRTNRWHGDNGRFVATPEVAKLPRLRGKSVAEVQKILKRHGFVNTNPSNLRNQRWKYSDGSEVQIHKYGGVTTGPYKNGNNALIHKSVGRHGNPGTNELADDGKTTIPTHSDAAHIGVKNASDYPSVSGRPHGT